MKINNKYKYIQGKQITEQGAGNRLQDIYNSRLPSVTTILVATKNKKFLKDSKDKGG